MFHFLLKSSFRPQRQATVACFRRRAANVASFLIRRSFSTLVPPPPPWDDDEQFHGLPPKKIAEITQRNNKLFYSELKRNCDILTNLFESYGFPSDKITPMLAKIKGLFFSKDPEEFLRLKLEFLTANGIVGEDLVWAISASPSFLSRSLEDHIAPSFDLLNAFFAGKRDAHAMVRRGMWILSEDLDVIRANIVTLISHGVPREGIARILLQGRPGISKALSREAGEFSELVMVAKKIGFDPAAAASFASGIFYISSTNRDDWVIKIKQFKAYGWSDEQICSLIVRWPRVMRSSWMHLWMVFDLLMGIEWGPEEISKFPLVLIVSFDKWLLPRFLVLLGLEAKGVIDEESFGPGLCCTYTKFGKSFVYPYVKDMPNLLKVYNNLRESY